MTVVVTGASTGIGAALTRSLAAAGHRVFVCARRADLLAKVTEDGRLATPFVCDVADPSAVADFSHRVLEKAGTVDALVNNAGTYGAASAIGEIESIESNEWLKTLQTNLYGTFLMSKAFVPQFRRAGGGRIVNFSGGGAFSPLPRYSAYAVSKAGVVRLTETMAEELAPARIWVNAVAPGFVATDIHKATLEAGPERTGADFHRMTREKMASGSIPIERPVGLVHYLLSPQAAGLTGRTISASFDPWDKPGFAATVAEQKDLYTMRRINLEQLKK